MTQPEFRFSFDEIVRVVSDDPELADINGELGSICGRTEDPAYPEYGIFIYRDSEVWQVEERYLESTGKMEIRERPTHALRVRVDEEGRGELVDVVKL